MADVQISEPLAGENFTDRGWRAVFAGRTGIVCDTDGSAFGLTLPAEGATAELGSATLPSRLVVDGYGLEIAQGATQSLDIPASSGGGTTGRTDLIVARLNLSAFTTPPASPVRLFRIAGVEGSLSVPAATYDPDGIRDLPLYAVRRRQDEGLNQAIVTDLRPRIGYLYDVPAGGTLPASAPLGSRATRGSVNWRMARVGSSVDWVEESRYRDVLTGAAAVMDTGEAFEVRSTSTLARDTGKRSMNLAIRIIITTRNPNPEGDGAQRVARLAPFDRPTALAALAAAAQNTAGFVRGSTGYIDTDGWVVWNWAATTGQFPVNSTVTLTGDWLTATA